MRKLRVILAVLAVMLLSFGIMACQEDDGGNGDIFPTGIQLNTAAHTIEVGETYQLVPSVAPEGVAATVIWTSSDPGKATVDASGVVTGVAAGETNITAKIGDVSASAKITVTAKDSTVAVSSVTLNSSAETLEVDGTFSLLATVLPENATDKRVTWTTSKDSVATVSNIGLVTAVGAGTVTITATAGSKSATATITVTAKDSTVAVESITIEQKTPIVYIGGTFALKATVLPENATDKTVVWSTDKSNIATVSEIGVITGVSEGTATITATAGGKSATVIVDIVIKPFVPVDSIMIDYMEPLVYIGGTFALKATVLPENATDKTVVWSTNKSYVATVSGTGVITGVSEGNAIITATAGGKSTAATVFVIKKTVPVESIAFAGGNTPLTIEVDYSSELTAVVLPENATDKTVTWSTSNNSIASVYGYDEYAYVYGRLPGTVVITATAGGKSTTITVHVVAEVKSVILQHTAPTIYADGKFQFQATVLPSYATDKTITWTTDKASVATVSDTGVVTGVSTGTATITATAGDKSATATVKVVAAGTPIAISTAVDLELVRNNLSGIFYLKNDIDFLGTSIKPIGDQELSTVNGETGAERPVPNGFRGIFDGRGYTMKNFAIIASLPNVESGGTQPSTSYNNALFPGLYGGTIRNLAITGVTQDTSLVPAGISRASLLVNSLYSGTIENVYIEGTIGELYSNYSGITNDWRRGGTVFGGAGDLSDPVGEKYVTVRNVITNVSVSSSRHYTTIYPIAGRVRGSGNSSGYTKENTTIENIFVVTDELYQSELVGQIGGEWATSDWFSNIVTFDYPYLSYQDYSALDPYFWDTSGGLPKLRKLTATFKDGDVTVAGNNLTGAGYSVTGDAAVNFEKPYAFSVTLGVNFRQTGTDSITVAYKIGNVNKTVKARSESNGEYTFVIPIAYDNITIMGVSGITEFFAVAKAGKDGDADVLQRLAFSGADTVDKNAGYSFTLRISEGNTAAADGISTDSDENLYVAYKIGDGSEVVLLDSTITGASRVEPDESGYYHFTVPAGVVTDDLVIVVGGIEKILGFYDIDLYDGGELFAMTGNNNDPSAAGEDEDKASAVFDYTVIIEIDSAKAVKVGDIVISFTVNEGSPSEVSLSATAIAGDDSGTIDYTGKWIATIHADNILGPIVITDVSGIYKIEEVEFADDSGADYIFAGALGANCGENYEFTVTMDATGQVPVVVYTIDGVTKNAEFIKSNGLEFTFSISKEDITGKIDIHVESIHTHNSLGVSTFGKADNFELNLTAGKSVTVAWSDIIDPGFLTGVSYFAEMIDGAGEVSINNDLVYAADEGASAGETVSVRIWLIRDGSAIAYVDITVSMVLGYNADDLSGWTAIRTKEDLAAIYTGIGDRANLSKNYYLVNDIDFEDAIVTPIGNQEVGINADDSFKGTFDGRGHTLKNFTLGMPLDGVSIYNNALFPGLAGGTIRNLSLVNVTSRQNCNRVSLLVNTVYAGTIENVYIEGVIRDSAAEDNNWMPGGTVVGGHGDAAGSFGPLSNVTLRNIVTNVTVTGTNADRTFAVTGRMDRAVTASGIYVVSDGLQQLAYAKANNDKFSPKNVTVFSMATIGSVDFSALNGEFWTGNVAGGAATLPKLGTIAPNPAVGVTIEPALALIVGEQKVLKATVSPNLTSRYVSWSVTNGDAVTLSAKGLVTAVKAGEATVTATIATATGTETADCVVTVTEEPVPVEHIILNCSEATLYVSSPTLPDKVSILANVLPKSATNKKIIWTTGNPDVAQVSTVGQVFAISEGTAIITATSEANPLASASVEITVEVGDEWIPIGTPEEFKAALNNSTRTGAYYLTDDIDFNYETIATIGGYQKENAFRGVFDGRGHTIKNFYTHPTTMYTMDGSLFAGLGAGGVIRNVAVIDANIVYYATRSGILVGTLHGGTVENVYLEGTIGSYSDENWARTGMAFGGTDGSPTGVNSGKVTIRNVVVNPTGFRGMSSPWDSGTSSTYRLVLSLQNGPNYNDPNYFEVRNFYGMTDIVTGAMNQFAGSNEKIPKSNIQDFKSWDIDSIDFSQLPDEFWEGNVASGATELPRLKVLDGVGENISLDKDTLTLDLYDTFTLTPIVNVLPLNGVKWFSTNPNVATVNQNGSVIAVAEGTATIIASIGTDAAVCEVRVGPAFTSNDITAYHWSKPKDPASAPFAAPTVETDGSLKFTTNAVAPVFDPAVTRTPINTLGAAGATSQESTASFMLKTTNSFTIPFIGGEGGTPSSTNNVLILRYNGIALQIARSVGLNTSDLIGSGSLEVGTVIGSTSPAKAGFIVGGWNRIDIVVSAMAAHIGSAAGDSVIINDSIAANGDGLVVTKIYINGGLVIWENGIYGLDAGTTFTVTGSTDSHAAAVKDGVWYQRRCSATVQPTSNPGRYGIGLAFVPANGNPIYIKSIDD